MVYHDRLQIIMKNAKLGGCGFKEVDVARNCIQLLGLIVIIVQI